MEIEKLLTLPESKTLEFKQDLSSLDPILKTIIAFANTAGGILIIGRASDSTLVGVKDVFKAEEMLANSIADSIRPSCLPEIEIKTIDSKDLLVVKVSHWRAPFYLKKLGFPEGVYIRLGSTSRQASPELLAELQRSVLTLSFDQQALSDLTPDVLQQEHITNSFQAIGKEIKPETLRSLNIVTPFAETLVPTIGGLILFGKKEERLRLIPESKISCARFLSDHKTNILDHYDVQGTILQAVEEVPKFIARNTRLAAQIQEIRRKDIPEYPTVAIREALVNALVHADYSMKGSHIQIAIFDDRLEIQNPGMFPFGFTIDDLKAGVSRVRNRVIARVFHELRLMEQWGSGYRRIIEACHNGGYPEPKWEEIGMTVRVTFYPHPQVSDVQRKSFSQDELNERQKDILKLFENTENLPFRAIFRMLPQPFSERMLRYELARLKEIGMLFSTGQGRSTAWHKSRYTQTN